MQERRTRPATVADFHRLANLAEARGIDVLQDHKGRWMATSASTAGLVYALSGFSCSCAGFVSHQRCTHHSLLLRRLGWLLELEPALPFIAQTPADCGDCCGCGVQDFGRYALPCETCGGSGLKPDYPPQGRPAVEVVATAA